MCWGASSALGRQHIPFPWQHAVTQQILGGSSCQHLYFRGNMQSRNRYISERLLDAALAAMYQENLQPLALSSLQCVAGDAQYFLGNFESANELYRQGFETAPQVQIAEKYLLRGVFNAEEVSAAAALVSLPHRVADAGRWVSLPVSEFQSTLAEVENLDAPYIDHLVLYLWETANFRRLRLFVE